MFAFEMRMARGQKGQQRKARLCPRRPGCRRRGARGRRRPPHDRLPGVDRPSGRPGFDGPPASAVRRPRQLRSRGCRRGQRPGACGPAPRAVDRSKESFRFPPRCGPPSAVRWKRCWGQIPRRRPPPTDRSRTESRPVSGDPIESRCRHPRPRHRPHRSRRLPPEQAGWRSCRQARIRYHCGAAAKGSRGFGGASSVAARVGGTSTGSGGGPVFSDEGSGFACELVSLRVAGGASMAAAGFVPARSAWATGVKGTWARSEGSSPAAGVWRCGDSPASSGSLASGGLSSAEASGARLSSGAFGELLPGLRIGVVGVRTVVRPGANQRHPQGQPVARPDGFADDIDGRGVDAQQQVREQRQHDALA